MPTEADVLAARWPQQLVKRIAAQDFLLVIGAGVSVGSTNDRGEHPPSWRTLLESLSTAFSPTAAHRTAVARLIRHDKYLEAAEMVKAAARKVGREVDFLRAIADSVDGQKNHHFRGNDMHDALLRLEPLTVVTTNYDRIWERAGETGYKVHDYGSQTLAYETRLGSALLVKVHGTYDDETGLILTRSDFSKVRQEGAHVLEVLQALFLTRSALFVGYGFADPDIKLLLENVVGVRGGPPTHFWLTGDNLPDHERLIVEECYGTAPINYRAGDYAEAQQMLELLGDLVDAEKAMLGV